MSFMSNLNTIAVWNKGTTIPNYDAAQWRQDSFGNVPPPQNLWVATQQPERF